MTAMQVLQLEDPEGSIMRISRIDNSVYAVAVAAAVPDEPFRLFEADRAKLRAFLTGLDG